ncbi:MAG TPA: DUF4097 family beta strand repeat-containing protein [Bacteroidota bacterium]|nr:DUF4097 family beta strand repeat-containing protein [Bacteroidota bacterium]
MKKSMIIALMLLAAPFVKDYALRADDTDDTKATKTFTVTKGGELELSVNCGDVKLKTWDKDQVSITVEGIDGEDLDDVHMTQSGNTVRVEYRPRWNWQKDVTFRVSLPEQFDADVHTSGGNIDVRGTMKGKLTGYTSGGDISTEKIEGATTLKTSGGDITLGDVGGEADVRTSGGEIKVERVGKSLKASTAGGDVEVGDVGGDAVLSSSGGEVKVGKVSGSATLRTAGGDVELRSASGDVEAKTAGGNIRLENITGSISAKTAGGDILAELMPSGKGMSELRSSGGNVVLSLPEKSNATIDATIKIQGRWMRRSEEYDIRSDFAAESKNVDKDEEEIHAVYKLNGGGERITIETTNGNIDIRKLSGK